MFTKVAYTYESNVFSMFACKHAEASNITSHHQSLEIFVRAASILSNSDPTLANYNIFDIYVNNSGIGVEKEVRVNNDLAVFNCKVISPQSFDRKQGK